MSVMILNPLLVDVRPDIAAGREPFSKIMEAARSVKAGDSFTLLAPFEPEPLYGILGRQGFSHVVEDRGSEGFRVVFHRAP